MVAKVPSNGVNLTDFTISGTTPFLTIGDAGAEDAGIIFDGNAVDFVVGLDDSADEFRIGVGSGLGSDRVFEINSSGVSTFQKAVHFAGTTPTVTVGDGGAEDAAIVFDGNAQDFHIGLDDSADDLVFGVGSSLGTTTALSIDENRVITVASGSTMTGALRPSFSAHKDGNAQTIANNTNTKVTFETEIFDSDSKFASSRFTPTVAGQYFFTATVAMTNHPVDAYVQIRIKKNGSDSFSLYHRNDSDSAETDMSQSASWVFDMDSDDYVEIFIRQNSGGDENTRTGQELTFSGFRIN